MWKLRVALGSVLISVATHLYLTIHYYALIYGGAAGKSACNINALFDCDAVSASAYSALFGIPLASLGAYTNGILGLLILVLMFRLTENPDRVKRYALYLSGFIGLMSLVMGGVSLSMLNAWCIFCIGTYALSFLSFEMIRQSQSWPVMPHVAGDLKALFGPAKGYLILLIAVPAFSYLTHFSMLSQHGAENISRKVNAYIGEWKVNPKMDFAVEASLVKGPDRDQAKMVIQEFADFKCGFCGLAFYPIKNFAKAHEDVRVEFYAFPLDGECNEHMKQAKSGLNCRLAKATYCAGKQDKGWEMHDHLFENQDDFKKLSTTDKIDTELMAFSAGSGITWDLFKLCLDSEETHQAIKAQANLGHTVGISGTPSIYVNGRKFSDYSQYMIKLFEAAYSQNMSPVE